MEEADLTLISFCQLAAERVKVTLNGLYHHYQVILKLSAFRIILSEICCE